MYFDMGQAFGLQCIYEDLDRPLAVALATDGDLVSVPRGYHPTAALEKKQYVRAEPSREDVHDEQHHTQSVH